MPRVQVDAGAFATLRPTGLRGEDEREKYSAGAGRRDRGGVASRERARSCFENARELGESAEILDGLSEALHFQGEYLQAIELKERAFAAYRRRGRRVEAAGWARWLAFLQVSVHGNLAAANGWMARAESLLDGVQECAAHGWLTLDRAPWSRDPSERERLAASALAIAKRFGDADLEFDALWSAPGSVDTRGLGFIPLLIERD